MTHQLDVANGRDIVARWCALAEQRLEYLSELFETGRWRRFHSEHAFLENIEEAKAAVKTWRELSSREASCDNRVIDKSWLGRTKAAVARSKTWRDPAQLPWPARIPDDKQLEKPAENLPEKLHKNSSVPVTGVSPTEVARSAPVTEGWTIRPVEDLAATVAQRYPLLRNRL
jgi:uncharacterized repeat protein (TIGR03809 family)